MRTVDCKIWKHKTAIASRTLYFIFKEIHPAAVKCLVWASLVGRSSHVKLSVRSIARSILRCWSLWERNQTVIQGRGSAEKFPKDRTKLLIFFFEKEILLKQASENWTLNKLSGLRKNNVYVLNISTNSIDKTFCRRYQIIAFDCYTRSLSCHLCQYVCTWSMTCDQI